MSFIRSRKNYLEEISGVLFSKGAPAPHAFTYRCCQNDGRHWEWRKTTKRKMAGNKDETGYVFLNQWEMVRREDPFPARSFTQEFTHLEHGRQSLVKTETVAYTKRKREDKNHIVCVRVDENPHKNMSGSHVCIISRKLLFLCTFVYFFPLFLIMVSLFRNSLELDVIQTL